MCIEDLYHYTYISSITALNSVYMYAMQWTDGAKKDSF